MFSAFFGLLAIAMLAIITSLLFKLLTQPKEDKYALRRARKCINAEGKVISLSKSLNEDIYKEALLINYRQQKVNEALARGELSDDVTNEQIKLEFDRERVIEKSLRAGILDDELVIGHVNTNSATK